MHPRRSDRPTLRQLARAFLKRRLPVVLVMFPGTLRAASMPAVPGFLSAGLDRAASRIGPATRRLHRDHAVCWSVHRRGVSQMFFAGVATSPGVKCTPGAIRATTSRGRRCHGGSRPRRASPQRRADSGEGGSAAHRRSAFTAPARPTTPPPVRLRNPGLAAAQTGGGSIHRRPG